MDLVNFLLYIVLGLIGFRLLMQIIMKFAGGMKKGAEIPEVNGPLGQLIKSSDKTLLLFYSPYCSACKPMERVVDKMNQDGIMAHKVDISTSPEAGKAFKIMATPTTVVIENEKISHFMIGAKGEKSLRKIMS